jgi:hypothetical protein
MFHYLHIKAMFHYNHFACAGKAGFENMLTLA